MVKPPALMPKPRQEVSPKLSTRLLPDRGHHDKAQRSEQRSGADAAPLFSPKEAGGTSWSYELTFRIKLFFNV